MRMLKKRVWNYMKQINDIGSNKDEAKELIETANKLIKLVEEYINI